MTTAANASTVTIPQRISVPATQPEAYRRAGALAAARQQFDETELAALILSASMMNFWNRVAITSRTTPGKRG